MSKEALKKIGSTTYYDWNNKPLSEHFKEEFDSIDKSLTELEELKRYPTADEVCVELDKWYIEATGDLLIANINDFTYDENEKRFYKRMLNKPHQMTICRLDTNDCVQLREPLSPHLITLIGRFYEGLEKVGK